MAEEPGGICGAYVVFGKKRIRRNLMPDQSILIKAVKHMNIIITKIMKNSGMTEHVYPCEYNRIKNIRCNYRDAVAADSEDIGGDG